MGLDPNRRASCADARRRYLAGGSATGRWIDDSERLVWLVGGDDQMTIDTSGFHKGRHYTTYVEDVKALKRAGDYARVEALLLALVQATENEARVNRSAVAPWYYDQLAIVYRKTKQPEKELRILDRYAGCWRREDGPLPADTVTAIEKARQRAMKGAANPPARVDASASAVDTGRRTTCKSCGFEHQALTRCPRCGATRRG